MKIPNSWSFRNKEIADNFDTHVKEQLPWYSLATDVIEHIARQYLPKNGLLYDIGAATGNISRAVAPLVRDRQARYIGIEDSEEMVNAFSGYGDIVLSDASAYAYENYDVCIIFLTLMFLPVKKQEELLLTLMKKINPGGCLIVVDKCQSESGYISTVLARLTLRFKLRTTSAEDILNKELSLSGVQRPIRRENMDRIGVEFFRIGDFAGWIIEGKT